MSDNGIYIGLISGTSVDGIDCVLVSFENQHPNLIAAKTFPLAKDLRAKVIELCKGQGISLSELGGTHIALGRAFAEAAKSLAEEAGVDLQTIAGIGSHGQTIWHEPESDTAFTLQLADPNTIAQRTAVTTVADFRSRDIAAGGQGAPLAPLLHRQVFHSPNIDRIVANIGGISNITVLPRSGNCLAFDTGPGNVLMDYWMQKHHDQPYDRDGQWAASGQMQPMLLNAMLDVDYLKQTPPKSTGRELFNGAWLESVLDRFESSFKPEDVQATLLMFTATSIASDILKHAAAEEIYICGGGAHNKALMQELSNVLGDTPVATTSKLGIDPDWVEATAFAWMARETLSGRAIDTRDFTGASAPVVLGGVYSA